MNGIKRSWILIAGGLLVLVIGAFVISHLLDADTYRARIEKVLSDSLGRPVQMGHLDFSLFSGSLKAESLSVADDPSFSAQPFLTAQRVNIGVEVMPLLLSKKLHIRGFTIEQPRIALIRAENGTWNYSSIGAEGKRKAPDQDTDSLIPNLTVSRVAIVNGSLTVTKLPQGQPHTYSDLNVNAEKFNFASAFPFTVDGKLPSGGSVSVKGNAGPINQKDASLTPVTADVSVKQADLVAAGLVEAAEGISGVANLDAKIVSDGTNATAEGSAHVTQLKLAKNGTPSSKPVDVQFSTVQNLQSLSGNIKSSNVMIGRAALAVSGTYTTKGSSTQLQLHAGGKSIPVDELVAFLPSLGIQLPAGSRLQGGSLTASLDITGDAKNTVVAGPVQIVNTQLAGFDLGQKLATVQAFTGAKTGSNTTIQALSTNLRFSNDGIQTNNLAAVIAGLGSATGSGSISPANALNYRLVVKLSNTGVGGLATTALEMLPGLLGSVGKGAANGIPMSITGTTSNPVFTPDVGKILGGSVPSKGLPIPGGSIGKALSGLLGR